jgi:predicted amidophosphoribosyltransferase
VALLAYEDGGRELLARLKYRNARDALRWLAAGMAAAVAGSLSSGPAPDPVVVTWAPTTAARRRARGFDQAELLARAVARTLGLPCRRLLRRHPGPPQTGRDLEGRRAGPVFTARRRAPPRVLLVDDVVTSGATVTAAARALRAAGAAHVVVVAGARTPLKAVRH